MKNSNSVRLYLEQIEKNTLSKYATLSSETKGRTTFEEECSIRPAFQHDRDRIVHSKAFRKLEDKTQVFLSPTGSHYRNRLTHTLEVSQTARTVARALMLNESLTEAIAMGHDLGHTPFGHSGERALSNISGKNFRHEQQSLRVVTKLAKDGKGLNLTWEVKDGIVNHSKGKGKLLKREGIPSTLEGQIVRLADILAYVNHDIDDAVNGGFLKEEDIPFKEKLGVKSSERIGIMITDMIETSSEMLEASDPFIRFSDTVNCAIEELRAYLFENLYETPMLREEFSKAERVVESLFAYFLNHYDELPNYYYPILSEKMNENITDFIASMTDSYAIDLYNRLFVPSRMKYPELHV